ncbi:MAG: class I SAM-dependent methyltransferase [Vulcanimicrobiaceae bacterium]
MTARDGFDSMYRAINTSLAYRAAVRASETGLPDWLVPFSFINAALLELITATFRLGTGDTVIDLACGAGGAGVWVVERTGAALIGVDFAPAAIEAATLLAEHRCPGGQARFITAEATATELPAACASAVMCIDALMFIDAAAVATEIARLLKPGGIFIATAAESLGEALLPTLVADYRPIFEEVGFRTLRHEELAGHDTQRLAFYHALEKHADALRAEIGDAAERLLAEARNGLERATHNTQRVRQVLFIAERADA